MKKRMQVLFSGQVQGVGFRYTAERLAHHFPITGYVRNLSTGQVEVVAEGDEQVLKDFIEAIRDSSLGANIRSLETHYDQATGEFHAFGIAHSF